MSSHVRSLLICGLALAVSACTTLPTEYDLVPSEHQAPVETGELTQLTTRLDAGESGFYPIFDNHQALALRLDLVDQAQQSLDIQYFIWKDDNSGNLMLDRVIAAAERGVSVRILVDDLLLIGGDRSLALLDSHPNIDIRVFNPWKGRGGAISRGFEFLFNMKRLNHRMHNKFLLVDGRVGITGGRNIGDEYYGLYKKYNFRDLDLFTVGAVVSDMSRLFDLLWNSDHNVPGEAFDKNVDPSKFEDLKMEVRDLVENSPVLQEIVDDRHWDGAVDDISNHLTRGVAQLLYDYPVVGENTVPRQMIDSLDDFVDVEREIVLVSAYFIPEQIGVDEFQRLEDKGIQIKILTNSLASTDESVSNSGYKKYRRPVLNAGVELFEVRHDIEERSREESGSNHGNFVALHTKAAVIDQRRVYVGTLNYDPRSMYLNTESGLIIDDPLLAESLRKEFETDLGPEYAWQVLQDENNRLYWKAGDLEVTRQPARSFLQRFEDGFYSLLPLEKHL